MRGIEPMRPRNEILRFRRTRFMHKRSEGLRGDRGLPPSKPKNKENRDDRRC